MCYRVRQRYLFKYLVIDNCTRHLSSPMSNVSTSSNFPWPNFLWCGFPWRLKTEIRVPEVLYFQMGCGGSSEGRWTHLSSSLTIIFFVFLYFIDLLSSIAIIIILFNPLRHLFFSKISTPLYVVSQLVRQGIAITSSTTDSKTSSQSLMTYLPTWPTHLTYPTDSPTSPTILTYLNCLPHLPTWPTHLPTWPNNLTYLTCVPS